MFNLIAIPVLSVICLSLGVWCYRLRSSRNALQHELSVVKSDVSSHQESLEAIQRTIEAMERRQQLELTQEQIDFKEKLQTQYAVLFRQVEEKLREDLKAIKDEAKDGVKGVKDAAKDAVKKANSDFEATLKKAFDDACEKIKFNEIEYKRTITKKRREYSRKNGKNAKPQRVWRYIDEEMEPGF